MFKKTDKNIKHFRKKMISIRSWSIIRRVHKKGKTVKKNKVKPKLNVLTNCKNVSF